MGTYSKLCEWRCLHQQIVPLTKCAGIDAQASQGVQPLVRNEVTQNSPDFNRPGCFPRRAHIQGLPLYRSAPFQGMDFFLTLPLSSAPRLFSPHGFSCDFIVLNRKRPPANGKPPFARSGWPGSDSQRPFADMRFFGKNPLSRSADSVPGQSLRHYTGRWPYMFRRGRPCRTG